MCEGEMGLYTCIARNYLGENKDSLEVQGKLVKGYLARHSVSLSTF